MWHELGHQLADLRVGFGPITFVRGLDGYVDGTGFSRISHTLDVGPEIDQSAALFMWAEAILFPSAWRDRDDLDWATVDDATTDVSLPFGEGRLSARVTFDRGTWLPSRFSDRTGRSGRRLSGALVRGWALLAEIAADPTR